MAKQIHEKVAPVITWLRTAEEESDEEEEDEEVEVVYSEKASKTGLVTETIQVENVSISTCLNVLFMWRVFYRVVTVVILTLMLFETSEVDLQMDYII